MTEKVTVRFTGLRKWQDEVWDQLQRFSVLVIHRGAGKTVLAILWLLYKVVPIKNGRGAYLAPQFNQAKRVAWDYMRRYGGAMPGAEFNEGELRASFASGAVIYLLGADNPDSLRGIHLDAAVLDEVAQMPSRAWTEVIRPALSQKRGSALFIGTVMGMFNIFYDLYRLAGTTTDWFRVLLTAHETHAIDSDELKALKSEMRAEEFAQEYLCDWSAAVKGAFFGKEMAEAERSNRVRAVPADPALPVHTSWDLGMADLTVIWFWQTAGSEIRALRCLSFQSTSLADIVGELRKLPYRFGQHYLPHDAKVRELGTGRSRQEILELLGIRVTITPEIGLRDGIEALRTLIPMIYFDREGCLEGIEALKTYRTDWNDKLRTFRQMPLHSWESHYADAARYFAISQRGKETAFRKLDYSKLDRAVI